MPQLGHTPGKEMLGGSSVMDPTSFTVGNDLIGLAGGSPVPLGGTTAVWKSYVAGFLKVYPKAPPDSLFTVLYYNGMQSIIQGLKKTSGDPTALLKGTLAALTPTFPNGSVRLDANRNSIQNAFVVQIVQSNGKLNFKVIKTIPNVTETFGGLFGPNSPAPSRTLPACTKGTPPPWAK